MSDIKCDFDGDSYNDGLYIQHQLVGDKVRILAIWHKDYWEEEKVKARKCKEPKMFPYRKRKIIL